MVFNEDKSFALPNALASKKPKLLVQAVSHPQLAQTVAWPTNPRDDLANGSWRNNCSLKNDSVLGKKENKFLPKQEVCSLRTEGSFVYATNVIRGLIDAEAGILLTVAFDNRRVLVSNSKPDTRNGHAVLPVNKETDIMPRTVFPKVTSCNGPFKTNSNTSCKIPRFVDFKRHLTSGLKDDAKTVEPLPITRSWKVAMFYPMHKISKKAQT